MIAYTCHYTNTCFGRMKYPGLPCSLSQSHTSVHKHAACLGSLKSYHAHNSRFPQQFKKLIAADSTTGAAKPGGQTAGSGKAAAPGSLTSDVISAKRQWESKDDKLNWAELLDSEGPLELDAMCWFYLDPFVSPIFCISSTSLKHFYVCIEVTCLYACMPLCNQGAGKTGMHGCNKKLTCSS